MLSVNRRSHSSRARVKPECSSKTICCDAGSRHTNDPTMSQSSARNGSLPCMRAQNLRATAMVAGMAVVKTPTHSCHAMLLSGGRLPVEAVGAMRFSKCCCPVQMRLGGGQQKKVGEVKGCWRFCRRVSALSRLVEERC